MNTTSTLPETMKAAVAETAGPPNTLHIKNVPVPKLARNHVIIALEYAGLGVWDAAQRAGSYGPVEPGKILGADGSGLLLLRLTLASLKWAIVCTPTATATRLEGFMRSM
jgi:hypothetical protein